MAEQFKNLASTTLAEDLDASETDVDVASAMGFSGGDFRILVDSEIMKVTGVSGTTLTVVRGQEGTPATPHGNGAAVKHVLTVGALDAHDQNDLAAYDTYANRPAAGVPGRIFLPTDGIFLERDNGSIWEKFGPIWPLTPPLAADFPTWVNQGTATFTDYRGAPLLVAPVNSNTNLRCRVKDYPVPPFTIEMSYLLHAWPYNGTGVGGLVIRDSISQKLVTIGIGGSNGDMQVQCYNWNSPTSSSGNVTGAAACHFGETAIVWLKYADDGNNRVVSYSVDGYNWVQALSISRTDWIVPNQLGIAVNSYCGYSLSSGQCDTALTLLHWRQY
jgi:hypothetical protein